MIGLYDAIADRIRVGCPALMQVETGMSPDAIDTLAQQAIASALVHPLSDEAAPVKEGALIVSQREIWTIGITMAFVYPAGFAQFEPARDQVKARLRGWLPEGAATPLEYAGGRVSSYSLSQEGGLWTHLLRFRTTVQESYEQQP